MNQPLKLQTMYYIFLRRKQQFEQWVEENLHALDSAAYRALAEKFEKRYIEPLNKLQKELEHDTEG